MPLELNFLLMVARSPWSLFHFLMPGFLGSEARFKALFRNPIEKQGSPERLTQLRARITPFMLRRTKALVAHELPPKVETLLRVELSGKQADLYETIRLGMEKTVREALDRQGLAKSQITILDALLKLRQVCCDPRLVKLSAATKVKTSAKLEQLMTLLPDMLAEGRRILLFSQFTGMLTLIEAELKKHQIPWIKLTGQSQKRDALIEQFTSGSVPLFLISLKAGGTGLNLTAADYVYIGSNALDFEVPGTLGIIMDFELWQAAFSQKAGYYPLVLEEQLSEVAPDQICFLPLEAEDAIPHELADKPNACIILNTKYSNKTQLYRRFFLELQEKKFQNTVILSYQYETAELESFQLFAGADAGALLIDGFGDGIWLNADLGAQYINSTAFGILQATRTRISKTEYISCPSCGRTLFDLQETTAKIRQRTAHLKGLKIGIMGCIVNGPGEMADADYGYVGTGPGKINLYKEKTIVKRNIEELQAVEALVELIKEYGDWQEPKN